MKRTKFNKMFHCVYLFTDVTNGKQYIGAHSTRDIDDYYGSSGSLVKQISKEKGLEYFEKHFIKSILEFFPTKREANLAEKKYIKLYDTLVPNGYNILPNGGSSYPDDSVLKNKQNVPVNIERSKRVKEWYQSPKGARSRYKRSESLRNHHKQAFTNWERDQYRLSLQ
jgi:hypothetical protein